MAERPSLVMLVGSPRSGTTWLQSLLGAHEAIATPQETDIFRVYLEPLVDAWNRQMHGITDTSESRRRKGLPLALTAPEFDAAAVVLLRDTLAAVQRLKPGASVVVEKSPSHSLCVDTIMRFEPEARFLHIVRDGRDAVSSMLAASEGWGARWAPDSVARAARVWREHVEGARIARRRPVEYLEVRYEDLRGPDGPKWLTASFELAGVDVPVAAATELLAAHSFERQSNEGSVAPSILLGGEFGASEAARREPEGFFRKGQVGAWRNEWSVDDKRAFAQVAGNLLVELGYEPDETWVGGRTRPKLLTRVKHRAANSTARSLRSLADRVEQLPRRRSRS